VRDGSDGRKVTVRRRLTTIVALTAISPGGGNADSGGAALAAAFPFESYLPGSTAVLHVSTPAQAVVLQVFRAGVQRAVERSENVMHGVPVGPPRRLSDVRPRARLQIRIGSWPSGLYFVRLSAVGGARGFAPFVVRPRRLGTRPVAIVLPTRTWQAYNFRDDDGDGTRDTWYAMRGGQQARLGRPFLNHGVPPHYRRYDARFLRWLHATGRRVDVLAQEDLDELPGQRLAVAYRWLIFPGHHEYVTAAEYDAVTEFRDLGGNLAFLSANNFFWRIDIRGRTMHRVARWRDIGRPEARLIGVQYLANDRGRRKAPWIVGTGRAASWLFDGVPLRNGREFSEGNVEIDATTPSSPHGIEVVAEIPNLLGPGLTAQMTYYETAAGAKVFAAGAFTLAGNVYDSAVRLFLRNLWSRLAQP
jgi:hypothetical protein